MTALLKEEDVRRAIARQCEMAGGVSAWSAHNGISRTQVSEALSGRRPVTAAMANAAGFSCVTRYVPLRGIPNA